MLVSGGQILAIDKVNTGNTILGDGVQKPLYVNTDLIATTSSVSSVSSTLEQNIDYVSDKFNEYYPKFVTSAGVEFDPALAYVLKKTDETVVLSGVDLSDRSTGIIYISNADRASDDNDGLTPNTPVRTLEVAVQRYTKYYLGYKLRFSVIDSYDPIEIDLSKIPMGYSSELEINSDDSVIEIKGNTSLNLSIKAINLVRFVGNTFVYSCSVESEYIEFDPDYTYEFSNECNLNAKVVQLYRYGSVANQGKIIYNNKLLIKAMFVDFEDSWEGNWINLETSNGHTTIDAYSVSLYSIKSNKLSIKSHYLDVESISMGGDVTLIGNPEVSSYSGGQSSVYVSNIIKTAGAWASTVLIKDFDNVNIADRTNTLIDVPGMRIENAKYVYSSSDATGIRVDGDIFVSCSGSVSLQAKDVAVDGSLAIIADYIGFNYDGIVSARKYSLNVYEPNDESGPGMSLYNLKGRRSDVSDPSSEYDDCIELLKIKFYNVYLNRHIEVSTAEIECKYLSEYANPYFGDLTIISDEVYVGQYLAVGHLKLKTNKLQMGSNGPIGIGNGTLPSYLQSSNSDPNIIDVGVLAGAGTRGAFQFYYGNDQTINANINVDLMVMSNWSGGSTDQLLGHRSGSSSARGQITGRVGGLFVGSDGKLSPWPNDYKSNCDSYNSGYCTISIDWCTPDKLNFYIDLGAGNDSFTGLSPNSPVRSEAGLKKAMESVGGGSAFQCIHVAGSSLGGTLNFSDEYFSGGKFTYLEFVSCSPFMSIYINNLNCSILKMDNFNDIYLYTSNVSTMALLEAQYISLNGDSKDSTKYQFGWLYSKSHSLYIYNMRVGNIYSDCDSCSLNCTAGGTVSVHSKNQISIYGGSYSGSVNFVSDYTVRFSGNNSLYGYAIVDSPNIQGNIANQAISGTIELRGNDISLSDGSLNMGTSGSGRLWIRNCKRLTLPSSGISFFNFEVDIDAQYIGGGNLSHYGNNPGCLCRINASEIYNSCQIKLLNDTAYITVDKLGIPVVIMTAGPSYGSTKLVLEARDCLQDAVYYDNYTAQVGYPVDVELLIHDLYGDLFGQRTSPIIIGNADSKVINVKATILRDHTDGTWLANFNNSDMSGLVSDIQILNKSKQLVAGTGIEIMEQDTALMIYSSTPVKISVVNEDATELELEHGVITHIGVDTGVSTLTLTYHVDDTGTLGDTAFNCGFALEINPENTTFTQFQIHMITPEGTYNVPIKGLPSAFVRGKRYMGTLINEFATLAEYEPLTLIGN